MKPTDRAFDDPAMDAQPAAMLGSALGQVRFDAQPAQQPPGRLAIVRAIGVDRRRARARVAALAAHWRNVRQQRQQFQNVRCVRGGQLNLQGNATGVRDDMMFAAELPPVGRVWAGLLPTTHGPHGAAVHGGPRPIDQVGAVQFGQQKFVESIPHAGGLPVAQPAPTSHPATAAHLAGQVFPGNSCLQNEQNTGQRGAVVDGRTAAVLGRRIAFGNHRLGAATARRSPAACS